MICILVGGEMDKNYMNLMDWAEIETFVYQSTIIMKIY